MAWLCVDAGTSVIKSVVFAEDGRELAVARATVAVLHSREGSSEQDMEEVWRMVADTCRRAVSEAAVPIHAIATTAQGDGVWLVDAAGRSVQPAILWNDGRATQIVEGWRAAGVLQQGAKTSGSTSYPGLANSIWRWLKEHEPEPLRAAAASLTCNGWLFLRLTGESVADLSDASNPFCDLQRREYSQELLRLYGVEEQAHLLPPLQTETPMAGLLREAAVQIGVPAETPVVMAPYDIVSTASGAGCTRSRQACVILGTTICAEVVSDHFEMQGSGTTVALDQPGRFLHAMPTLTGCEALSWSAQTLGLASIEELEALAVAAAAGSDGLLFLPYLSTAGERSPFLHPQARGGWTQLSLASGRAQMARSVYEGLSYVVRECLAAAGRTRGAEVRVCGGGARSSFWCQMIADVIGDVVLRPRAEELGARGALLHGRVRMAEAGDLDAAGAVMPIGEDRFVPREDLRDVYDTGYARFLQARESTKAMWDAQARGGAA